MRGVSLNLSQSAFSFPIRPLQVNLRLLLSTEGDKAKIPMVSHSFAILTSKAFSVYPSDR